MQILNCFIEPLPTWKNTDLGFVKEASRFLKSMAIEIK
jgi:hypothetical protein